MQDLKQNQTDPRQLGPVALAFVGDGVFELLVRERLAAGGSMPAHRLHVLSMKRVRAASQAMAYESLENVLSSEELGILRRGRNAHTSRVPKSCTPEQYRKATAIEALFGYLYLKSEIDRIEELFGLVERVIEEAH